MCDYAETRRDARWICPLPAHEQGRHWLVRVGS